MGLEKGKQLINIQVGGIHPVGTFYANQSKSWGVEAKCQPDGAATKYFSKDFSSIQNTLFFPRGQLKAQTQN